jgi:hypothetical protein
LGAEINAREKRRRELLQEALETPESLVMALRGQPLPAMMLIDDQELKHVLQDVMNNNAAPGMFGPH